LQRQRRTRRESFHGNGHSTSPSTLVIIKRSDDLAWNLHAKDENEHTTSLRERERDRGNGEAEPQREPGCYVNITVTTAPSTSPAQPASAVLPHNATTTTSASSVCSPALEQRADSAQALRQTRPNIPDIPTASSNSAPCQSSTPDGAQMKNFSSSRRRKPRAWATGLMLLNKLPADQKKNSKSITSHVS